ncbi:hypothetical protein K435DRAFT_858462 [Dendrothele bispora CBS 962.96]|uniref:Uncharacterized protein n=1 Tax=Dendrothele bispora (strain CBS 962.96) TaxID=1314807 RepID=A0A4S8M2Z7_DENBC|nr:hypothetical protein K435DRAFT_858462 [Dendrothele bispora CBS 962.96]
MALPHAYVGMADILSKQLFKAATCNQQRRIGTDHLVPVPGFRHYEVVADTETQLQVQSDCQIDAWTYLPGNFLKNQVVDNLINIRGRGGTFYGDNLSQAIKMATSLTMKWLKFSTDKLGPVQAVIVRLLVDTFGSRILILQGVHNAIKQPEVHILGTKTRKKVDVNQIRTWILANLVSHPLTQKNTPETEVLDEIYSWVENCRPDSFQRQHDLLQIYAKPKHYAQPRNPNTPSSAVFEPQLSNPQIQTHSQPPPPSSISISTFDHIPAPPDPEQTAGILLKVQLLLPFLDNIAPLAVRPRQSAGLKDKFLWHVQQSTDRLLPFQDLAISRRLILADGGPYSPAHLRTRAGFFSAMIFWSVTFNAPIVQVSGFPTLFRSLADWKEAVEQFKEKQPNFFCNTNAYGPCVTDRSPKNIESHYVQQAFGTPLPWLLDSQISVSFKTLFDTFKCLKGLGLFTSFMLAVDYAIAGLVRKPSPAGLGKIVWELKKGGQKGLRNLHYNVDTEQETVEAFCNFHTYLENCIGQRIKEKMMFDVFITEHLLCKDSRLELKDFKQLKTMYGMKKIEDSIFSLSDDV